MSVKKTSKKRRPILARGSRGPQPGKNLPHRFEKGCKPGPGRPKGVPNVMTRILKEAILEAGENVGNAIAASKQQEGQGIVSYFEWCATEHPPAYLALVGRILPMQRENEDRNSKVPYKTVKEAQQALRDRGLPVERIYPLLVDLTQEDVDVENES
jgi:hypothetical protein